MYCSNCGKENEKTNTYCYSCGNKLVNNTIQNKTSGNQETSLVLGIICLVSSFIFNIICFIPGIISIIYAKKYKKESGKLGIGFGLSLGGMIFSVFMLLIGVLTWFFLVNTIQNAEYDYNYDYNYDTEYTNSLPKI